MYRQLFMGTLPRYRWWSLAIWWNDPVGFHGVKLGPVSLTVYQWDGWQVALSVWHRLLVDTGLRQHLRIEDDDDDAA